VTEDDPSAGSSRQQALAARPMSADDLYREEVLQARAMSPEAKLLAGPRLFDLACRIAEDGIRYQFPEAGPEDVRRLLAERLALGRRLESAP